MPQALPSTVKTQAVEMAISEGLTAGQVAKRIGVNRSTVKNWLASIQLPKIEKMVESVADRVVNRQMKMTSEGVREALAETVLAQAAALKSEPVKCVRDLANTPFGQGQAAVTKTVAETAALVFGWAAEKQSTTHFHMLTKLEVEPESVEVESEIVDQSVKNELDCGVTSDKTGQLDS